MNEAKYSIPYDEYRLDNGLEVVLSRDPSIPTVAINLCYKVGSKDEAPNKRGFAHLFEHLMYEGSKNIPCGEYDRYCLMAGGENNGYTNEDKTNYYIVLPAHELELGLWLESDRMHAFSVTEASLKTQKEVVKEEKKQLFDNKPYGTLSLEFPPRLFKNTGYGWDTIGDLEDIDSATLDDAKNFFENYYIPNNAVLSITGDLDYSFGKDAVQKYFGEIKQGILNRKSHEINNFNNREIRDTIYDNVHFPGLFMAYRIPKEKSKEHYIFDVLSDILSTGESSRFYRSLVYEKQLVSDIGCYIDSKEFTGAFYIYAILMPGIQVSEVETEIEKILNDIIQGNITINELAKIKNRIETRFASRMPSSACKKIQT